MCNVVVALALSAHIGLVGDYSSVHPAVYCEGDAFVAGAYLNSERSVSGFAAAKISQGDWWAELGIVTGYSSADILPYARIGTDLSENASLFIAPAYEVWNEQKNYGAIIGIEMKFGG